MGFNQRRIQAFTNLIPTKTQIPNLNKITNTKFRNSKYQNKETKKAKIKKEKKAQILL